MRLPFISSKPSSSSASGKAETKLAAKQRRDALDESEEDEARHRWKKTATGKKAIKKAERKHEAKKRAWAEEQERRRLDALARWESVLRSEPAANGNAVAAANGSNGSQPTDRSGAGPATVTSANGRLERTRSRSRSRRFLDVDRLDELVDTTTSSDEDEDETSEDETSDERNVVAGPTFQLGSSQVAQMSQVAAMRELPMLETCSTPQAPASFFVDMLLLGGSSSKPRSNHHHHHRSTRRRDRNGGENDDRDEAAAARRRRETDKLQRATRSCPSGSRKRPS